MPPIIAREPRKSVPPSAMVFKPYVDEREAVVEKAKKELGAKAKGMHFFYGDRNIAATDRYKDDGYIATGFNHKGDPLFMRPDKLHAEHIAAAASDSAFAYNQVKTGQASEYGVRTADGETVGLIQERE